MGSLRIAWEHPRPEQRAVRPRPRGRTARVGAVDGLSGPPHRRRGDTRETDTLGFRWSAIDNLFVEAGDVAADEWRGLHAGDEENAERELCQFVWALPHRPPKTDLSRLDVQAVEQRIVNHPRGVVPPNTEHVVVGVDLGQYLVHWGAIAFRAGASAHILDYGRLEVASADLGVERALMVTMRELRDQICAAGWPEGDRMRQPEAVWIDSGWMSDVVYEFWRESGSPYLPAKGFGSGQLKAAYRRPTSRRGDVSEVGTGYHVVRLRAGRGRPPVQLAEIDADHWKTWLHKRLTTPTGQPGAMTLYHALPNEHLSLAKHLTAERQIEEFNPRRGTVIRWERVARSNHWFDALYLACAAGHSVGVRLLASKEEPTAPITLGQWFGRQRRSRRR